MSKHKVIIGTITLQGTVEDDGTLAQAIAELIVDNFDWKGIEQVDIDFELSSQDISSNEQLKS